MAVKFGRRAFLAGVAATALPMPAIAQEAPVRVGLLTVKTGPLAEGGMQMEEGIVTFLKEKNYKLVGRKVDFISVDTGGSPAGAKTMARQLIERDKVDVIMGPLAAFELLAITDYVEQHKTPIMCLAGADDMTQRKPNPYLIRASATSSQATQPLGDFAAKHMKLKNVVTIAEDFAFGYEQVGGFQRVFQDDGGRVLKKLWPPLKAADYTPFIAQFGNPDAVVQCFAGSDPVKFMNQYASMGLNKPVLGGETAADDALLKSFGDNAIGLISACPYTMDLDNDANKRFVAEFSKAYGNIPGLYAAGLYINGEVLEAGLKKTGGRTDNKEELIKALRGVSLTDTPRGPISFDKFGNVIGNIYIRRVEKKNGKLVNKTIKTYEKVSQFWTFNEKWFLSQPVYSRDYPPLKA